MATTMTRTELVEKLRNVQTNEHLTKGLRERITYTLSKYDKNKRSVSNAVFGELANDISDEIKAAQAATKKEPVAVENSIKPKRKVKAKPAPEPEPEVVEEKPAPKAKPKAAPAKAEEVMFPAELKHEALGNLVAQPDKFKTMNDVRAYLDDGNVLYIAGWWTKKLLKQFEYGAYFDVPQPKEFDHNLDIMSVVLVCENIERLWAMSVYTEALLGFAEKDLTAVEGVKYSNGLEFEFYTPAE